MNTRKRSELALGMNHIAKFRLLERPMSKSFVQHNGRFLLGRSRPET